MERKRYGVVVHGGIPPNSLIDLTPILEGIPRHVIYELRVPGPVMVTVNYLTGWWAYLIVDTANPTKRQVRAIIRDLVTYFDYMDLIAEPVRRRSDVYLSRLLKSIDACWPICFRVITPWGLCKEHIAQRLRAGDIPSVNQVDQSKCLECRAEHGMGLPRYMDIDRLVTHEGSSWSTRPSDSYESSLPS